MFLHLTQIVSKAVLAIATYLEFGGLFPDSEEVVDAVDKAVVVVVAHALNISVMASDALLQLLQKLAVLFAVVNRSEDK